MTTGDIDAGPPAVSLVVLSSSALSVAVLPGNGADIYSITDRATGIDVLFKTPWGWREPSDVAAAGDSRQRWLSCYAGGWQQLVPNAGDPRTRNGVLQGYHGEAAIVPWRTTGQNDDSLSLSVELLTSPLRLERSVTVSGGNVFLTSSITNLSAVPVPVSWVEHPAFGAPFVDHRSRLYTGARRAVAAGHPLDSDVEDAAGVYPLVPDGEGSVVDVGTLPAPSSGRALFATLTDFASPWFAVVSPTAGFGMGLAWEARTFPHAWLWIEAQATADYPWFKRAYAVAVEPANVPAGESPPCDTAPVLAAGDTWTTRLTAVRIDGTAAVAAVHLDGSVERTAVDPGEDRR